MYADQAEGVTESGPQRVCSWDTYQRATLFVLLAINPTWNFAGIQNATLKENLCLKIRERNV
jgi:hypothetical protein